MNTTTKHRTSNYPLSARRVRAARILRGWSAADLAEASGLSTATISHVETGKTRPYHATREVIAQALGVKQAELFEA